MRRSTSGPAGRPARPRHRHHLGSVCLASCAIRRHLPFVVRDPPLCGWRRCDTARLTADALRRLPARDRSSRPSLGPSEGRFVRSCSGARETAPAQRPSVWKDAHARIRHHAARSAEPYRAEKHHTATQRIGEAKNPGPPAERGANNSTTQATACPNPQCPGSIKSATETDNCCLCLRPSKTACSECGQPMHPRCAQLQGTPTRGTAAAASTESQAAAEPAPQGALPASQLQQKKEHRNSRPVQRRQRTSCVMRSIP